MIVAPPAPGDAGAEGCHRGPLAGHARLDPAEVGVLRDLVADDYALCVREPDSSAARRAPVSYTLALGVVPAPR